MTPEKDRMLTRKFPLLYGWNKEYKQETNGLWGFDIGDGWYNLIYDLSAKLEAILEEMPKDECECTHSIKDHKGKCQKDVYFQVSKETCTCLKFFPLLPRVVQIKEKLSGLRFYMSSETPEMSALIREAESASFKICETCGESGKPRKDIGWIQTLCQKHYESTKARK